MENEKVIPFEIDAREQMPLFSFFFYTVFPAVYVYHRMFRGRSVTNPSPFPVKPYFPSGR